MKRFSFVLTLMLLVVMPCISQGAQSTKDVTASEELKEQARREVLGDISSGNGQQSEYVIGHGDILGVQVYGEGSMAVSAPMATRGDSAKDGLRGAAEGVQVRIDGRISLQHIGDVEVVGMTLTELADYLKILFATVYDEPIVTVVLHQSNSQRYTVMGKVALPGIYYLDYPINLVQVVARCGGFTEWANSEMTVVRKDSGKSELFNGNTLEFDYDDFLAGKKLEKNILIRSGDIIIVH